MRSRRAAAGRPRAGPGTRCAFCARPIRRSSAIARSSAASRDRPSVLRGASVTFSSTVMCGNRLNAWKTIPILRRSALTSTFGPVTCSPSITISPRSTASSRFRQRSSVDLPEPEAPIRQTTLCSVDVQRRRRAAPRSCRTASRRCAPRRSGRRRCADRASRPSAVRPGALDLLALADQVVGEARERDREQHEEHRGDDVAGEVEVRRRVLLGLLRRLAGADDRRGSRCPSAGR